jgi:hypothetical protein
VSARSRLGFALACVLAAGCGSSSPSAATPPAPPVTVRPIQIDSVEVLLQAAPSAHVRGVIGDGCTELFGTSVARGESTVTITIYAQRPTEAICTQIAKLYDEVLRLPGEYPAGTYVVRVNGLETTFTVP